MKPIAGAKPPERVELARFRDRLSFLYAERCVVHRESNAVTFTDDTGTTHAPAAMLAVLLLGPGTRVSHAAMSLLGSCGTTVVWMGEAGVRYYAHGRPVSGNSGLAEAQARLVSNTRLRLGVAREMYRMRFGDEDVSSASMSQLRGREGVRMRRRYREEAKRTGVSWTRRNFDPDDFAGSDAVNQALTAASSALYGIAHAAIVSVGAVPSLGFIHTGTDRAFVFDIADLYKAEIAIPLAFDVAKEGFEDVGGATRRAFREVVIRERLLQRMLKDIFALLRVAEDEEPVLEPDLFLWSEVGKVAAGKNYSGSAAS